MLEESEITDVAKHVIFLMQIARPDIDFVANLPDTPLKARFDHRLIGQALTNIVKNATEAMEPKPGGERGKVTVSVAKSKDDTITIDVTDTGRGFPKSERHKLLEPYTTTRKEGTGLGLAIVGRIVEEHGGGIELLDHFDAQGGVNGAWVRLWFPAGLEDDAADAAQAPPIPKASTLETESVENVPEGLP